MKCTIIFASPRKNGNTISLLIPFMDVLKDKGADVSFFDVYDLNIKGCRVCLKCQDHKEEVYCTIHDDMNPILDSMAESDLIVYASPIYLWAAPAPLKAVMDRSVYSTCRFYGEDPHGPALFEGKKMAIVTTCGYPVEKGTDLYEEMMRRYCKYSRMDYIGMLAERQKNLKESFMDPEKERHAKEFAALFYEKTAGR